MEVHISITLEIPIPPFPGGINGENGASGGGGGMCSVFEQQTDDFIYYTLRGCSGIVIIRYRLVESSQGSSIKLINGSSLILQPILM